MRYKILGIVFLIAVTAAVVSGVYYWQVYKQAQNPVSLPVHKDETADWEIWTTSERHFLIRIPADWIIRQYDAGGASLVSIYASQKDEVTNNSMIEIDLPEVYLRYAENDAVTQKIINQIKDSLIKNPTEEQVKNSNIIP